jgi:hypothetical protein
MNVMPFLWIAGIVALAAAVVWLIYASLSMGRDKP